MSLKETSEKVAKYSDTEQQTPIWVSRILSYMLRRDVRFYMDYKQFPRLELLILKLGA